MDGEADSKLTFGESFKSGVGDRGYLCRSVHLHIQVPWPQICYDSIRPARVIAIKENVKSLKRRWAVFLEVSQNVAFDAMSVL
jgi:hypothetical protein